jgi:hypothetical protein
LHAASISFEHPTKKEIVSFKADLPNDLQEVLDSLTSL